MFERRDIGNAPWPAFLFYHSTQLRTSTNLHTIYIIPIPIRYNKIKIEIDYI